MQDCPRCGKKIKTLYERHGAKATFEAMGYYCKACGILYDQELKKSADVSSMFAANMSSAHCDRDQMTYPALHAGGREFESLPIHFLS
jgi:hypothetical protein